MPMSHFRMRTRSAGLRRDSQDRNGPMRLGPGKVAPAGSSFMRASKSQPIRKTLCCAFNMASLTAR